MFQYSTETIINNNIGNLPIGNGVRFSKVTVGDNGMENSDNAQSFIVDGVGLYHGKYITRITRRVHVPAEKEQVKIKWPTTSDGTYRLAIWTSQEGLSSSTYADAQLRHKKPFFYEITKGDVQKFVDAIKAEMQMTDFNYFKASGIIS